MFTNPSVRTALRAFERAILTFDRLDAQVASLADFDHPEKETAPAVLLDAHHQAELALAGAEEALEQAILELVH